MKPPPAISTLICQASPSGPEAVRAVRQLVSLAEEDELKRCQQVEFWQELAERWRQRDPKRTKRDADALARKVCSALKAREARR